VSVPFYRKEAERCRALALGASDPAAAVRWQRIPHDDFGEMVHAEVVTKPGTCATIDEIIAVCREQIGGYKVPRSSCSAASHYLSPVPARF